MKSERSWHESARKRENDPERGPNPLKIAGQRHQNGRSKHRSRQYHQRRQGFCGSPADSGTQEEFESARRRHTEDPENMRVMFYFKNRPISLDDADWKQVGKVKEFKE